jgi:hypothetical protein
MMVRNGYISLESVKEDEVVYIQKEMGPRAFTAVG